MPDDNLEYCFECDQPTGRCGEDSMWDAGGRPLCEECWNKTPHCTECGTVTGDLYDVDGDAICYECFRQQ